MERPPPVVAGGRGKQRRPRRAQSAAVGETRYVPFVTPDQPRGKHKSYPMSVAEGHLRDTGDPIGFERAVHLSGGQAFTGSGALKKAAPIPNAPKPKRGEALHHLDPRARISPLELGPEPFVPYWDREKAIRGKSNKYPRELDPYPSSPK